MGFEICSSVFIYILNAVHLLDLGLYIHRLCSHS